MTEVLPHQVSAAAQLKKIWIVGRVVYLHQDAEDQEGQGKGKGAKGKSAKGKGKGNKKATFNDGNTKVLEWYLSGGTTPADVILCNTWEKATIRRVRPVLQCGTVVRCTNGQIKSHTEKTRPWTTSRLPYYFRGADDLKIESVTDRPEWPLHHPVTAVPDLKLLPTGTLVCIAGRVIESPRKKTRQIGGEDVEVANTTIRIEDNLITLAGFGTNSDKVMDMIHGNIYYLHAVAKQDSIDKETKTNSVEIRVKHRTKITECKGALGKQIADGTPNACEGGTSWTAIRGGPRRDYESEVGDWYTLSVCEAVCAPAERRKVDLVCQIPSVMIDNITGPICYLGCSKCRKGWQECQSCDCSDASAVLQWKVHASVSDSTAQVSVTFFTAFAAVMKMHATLQDDESLTEPESRCNNEEHLEALLSAIKTIPFTLVLSFDDSDYKDGTEIIVQLATPTFDNVQGVKHPLTKIIRFNVASYPCPPCALSETEFNPGVGLAVTPAGATASFRALLEVMDQARGGKLADGSTTLCVERNCACALRDKESTAVYKLIRNAPLAIATLMLQVRKGDYIHAVVAWRSSSALTLEAFLAIGKEEITNYRKFFRAECEILKATVTNSQFSLTRNPGETPLRIVSSASKASSANTQSQPWDTRSCLNSVEDD